MDRFSGAVAVFGILAAGATIGCAGKEVKPSVNPELTLAEKVSKLAELTERSGIQTKHSDRTITYRLKGPGDIIDNQSGPRFVMLVNGETKEFMINYKKSNFEDTKSYFDNIPYGILDSSRVYDMNNNPGQKEQQEYEKAINDAYNSIGRYQLR